MGNIFSPRKLILVKPRVFRNYADNALKNKDFNNFRDGAQDNVEIPSCSNQTCHEDSSRSLYTNGCTYISRSDEKCKSKGDSSNIVRSVDELELDLSSKSSSDSSISSVNSFTNRNSEDTLNEKKIMMTKKFKKICLDVPDDKNIRVHKVALLLETAFRNNCATLIDTKNLIGNTAVCIAIMRNDTKLLECLFKFIPAFPSVIILENSSVPLVQLAAIKMPNDSCNSNILSFILSKWIEDDHYIKVAVTNVLARNTESKALFEFLIDQIRMNNQVNIHFTNLELLFQLFNLIKNYEGHVFNVIYPNIIHLFKNLEECEFWNNQRRDILIGLLHNNINCQMNYCELIDEVWRINN